MKAGVECSFHNPLAITLSRLSIKSSLPSYRPWTFVTKLALEGEPAGLIKICIMPLLLTHATQAHGNDIVSMALAHLPAGNGPGSSVYYLKLQSRCKAKMNSN